MTTAYANDPMCAPTSMTMSVGAKRAGRWYSLSTTTPLKIIRSSVPRRNVHPSPTTVLPGLARLPCDERVAVADRVRRLPVRLRHQRHQHLQRFTRRPDLVRGSAVRRAALSGEDIAHTSDRAASQRRVD